MSALTERLHKVRTEQANKPVPTSYIQIRELVNETAQHEHNYTLEAALWQERAIAQIVVRNGYAHKAIGMLVTKLHKGTINLAIAESVFQSALLLDKE